MLKTKKIWHLEHLLEQNTNQNPSLKKTNGLKCPIPQTLFSLLFYTYRDTQRIKGNIQDSNIFVQNVLNNERLNLHNCSVQSSNKKIYE